ncbi:MAG: biotin/lipoate A/B protein ligase family protein [Cyanobacteria bacterium J06623_7]
MVRNDKIEPVSRWRYIPPLKTSGAMQMAIDRYLLDQQNNAVRAGTPQYRGVLRFYTWQPAAISLGYHQKDYPVAWHDLIWQGQKLELVRRPTGGSAVLHQGDLTYAVITSIPPGKRLEVYKQICQFLIVGWRSLGVELDYGRATKEYVRQQNCFATATVADLITVEGHKAIGSAQLRRRQQVLQHGSMMLNTSQEIYRQVFATELPQNLREIIPKQKDRSTPSDRDDLTARIISSLLEAASTIFKIDLVEQPLSTKEWQDIANLKHDFSLLRY